LCSEADGSRGKKEDQSTILRMRPPQGDSLHLSETRPEILAASPRKISPLYPSASTAVWGPVRLEPWTRYRVSECASTTYAALRIRICPTQAPASSCALNRGASRKLHLPNPDPAPGATSPCAQGHGTSYRGRQIASSAGSEPAKAPVSSRIRRRSSSWSARLFMCAPLPAGPATWP
jgi:hypothetical protein